MAQLENIEEVEKKLWSSADTLRANGNFASNEGFLPIMGLIFLRHAYSRYLALKPQIEAKLPVRDGIPRPLTKEDFSGKGAIFLREEAQFEYLVKLTDAHDRAEAIIKAMEIIEVDYEALAGVLPKHEYQELGNDVLGTLLRTFNDSALKNMTGDVFGRIYEYFLTKFADQGAHDNGEFFTPVSLVKTIVNVIEPDHGNIIDPACGSGGMFVQSAHFIEQMSRRAQQVATFYGMEKNNITIRLAKMNLAVHGLEGNIAQAISYYEEPHGKTGKCDFVMANPPFNVDEVDAEKVKADTRLPFGLPGVNKKDQVSNGNFLWISYFYSYLNDKGRAGFVMSSQASSAGGGEAEVRRKLIETGHVDVMMAIRSNFFYTRTVPCELWFLNKDKPKTMRDKVLMVDARAVYRKVTRKIYDFSPEQNKNLTAIVWLYRNQKARFLHLIDTYLSDTINAAEAIKEPILTFYGAIDALLEKLEDTSKVKDKYKQLATNNSTFNATITEMNAWYGSLSKDNSSLANATNAINPLVESSRDLIKQVDQVFRLAEQAAKNQANGSHGLNRLTKRVNEARIVIVEALNQVRHFYIQACWLQERFPEAKLCDVEGLVKLVDHAEIAENDWNLTPGRYVGVAPEEDDENFDFRATLRTIHQELDGLNEEAIELANRIQKNFEELGV